MHKIHHSVVVQSAKVMYIAQHDDDAKSWDPLTTRSTFLHWHHHAIVSHSGHVLHTIANVNSSLGSSYTVQRGRRHTQVLPSGPTNYKRPLLGRNTHVRGLSTTPRLVRVFTFGGVPVLVSETKDRGIRQKDGHCPGACWRWDCQHPVTAEGSAKILTKILTKNFEIQQSGIPVFESQYVCADGSNSVGCRR